MFHNIIGEPHNIQTCLTTERHPVMHRHALPHKCTPQNKSPNTRIPNSRHVQLHTGIPPNTQNYAITQICLTAHRQSHSTHRSSPTPRLALNNHALCNTRTHFPHQPMSYKLAPQSIRLDHNLQKCHTMYTYNPT